MATSNLQVLVIKAGETKVLPKGAKVVSVAKDGDISATSSCEDVQELLDNAEEYKCYQLRWAVDESASGGSHPWEYDNSDAKFIGFGYAGHFHESEPITGNNDVTILNFIKSILPAGVLTYSSSTDYSEAERITQKLVLKLPASIGDTFYLRFDVASYSPLNIYTEASTDCPVPSGG